MSNKLYVLVRGDLSKSQQAVQASHVVAEFMLNANTISCRCGHCRDEYRWENETIVLLKVKNLDELLKWETEIRLNAIVYCDFCEPDIGHEMTAVAAYGPKLEDLLKNLRLI